MDCEFRSEVGTAHAALTALCRTSQQVLCIESLHLLKLQPHRMLLLLFWVVSWQMLVGCSRVRAEAVIVIYNSDHSFISFGVLG